MQNHNVHHCKSPSDRLEDCIDECICVEWSLTIPLSTSFSSFLNHHSNTSTCSDPDIQHLPFFAISPVFIKSLWSSYYKREMTFDAFGKFLISVQHKLFYIVLSLARFNLYANSYGYLAKTAFEPRRHRGGRWWWWAEIVCLGLFFAWFGAVLKGCGSWGNILTYLLVSHIAASPVHAQVRTAFAACPASTCIS